MSLKTLFISGPSAAGKSTVARIIADHVLADHPAHYLRMRPASDGYTNAMIELPADQSDGLGRKWRSLHTVRYTPERIFETLPDGLRAIKRIDRHAFAVVEGDGDPALRHAYTYDYRVFVMPAPVSVNQVFRSADDAAQALQQVMLDTAAFASEIFGLFDAHSLHDSVGVHHSLTGTAPLQRTLERLELDESQMRQFLRSPIGVEIAARIQLQPDYHALVESDVVVINTAAGPRADRVEECVGRLEKLLARVRHDARRQSLLYWGDPTDTRDPSRGKLLRRLKSLLCA